MLSIRSFVKSLLSKFFILIFRFPFSSVLSTYYLRYSMNQSITVTHNDLHLKLSIPNSLCHFRAASFSSKEPETLSWIDNFSPNSVFWDIGANVGLYSIYAAMQKSCNVLSFEPSFFNLEILSRNINLNNLSSQISIVPIALSNNNSILPFNLSTLQWGGALSTFGSPINQHGSTFQPEFTYNTLGVSLDTFFALWSPPLPKYIKIDVDGLEHIILAKSTSVFTEVKSVLIEVSLVYTDQYEFVQNFLSSLGFTLSMAIKSEDGNQLNQIWSR